MTDLKKEGSGKKYLVLSLLISFVLIASAIAGYFYLQLTEMAAPTLRADTEDVKQIEAVIVGISPDYPPMEFMDANSEIVGYDIDVMNSVFERLGEAYILRPMKWSEKDELLENGEIDLIWSGLSITDERKQLYEMSISYLLGEQLLVVRTDSPIQSSSDLAGMRVAVDSEKFLRPALEKLQQDIGASFASVKEFPSISAAMVALLVGEADVTIAGGSSIRYHAGHSPEKFRILPEHLMRTEGAGVAAKKGNGALIDDISAALQAMKNDGTLQSIQRRWFGES